MTNKVKEKALDFVLENEGGYSNDPNDKGGETKYGISKRSHPEVDVANLTEDQAKEIYRKEYWNELYEQLPEEIAIRLFDFGVNIGVRRAVRVFQKTLNLYFGANLLTDGVFGSRTLIEANRHNSKSLYSMMVFEFSLYYQSLNSPFLVGWLNRLYRKIT